MEAAFPPWSHNDLQGYCWAGEHLPDLDSSEGILGTPEESHQLAAEPQAGTVGQLTRMLSFKSSLPCKAEFVFPAHIFLTALPVPATILRAYTH